MDSSKAGHRLAHKDSNYYLATISNGENQMTYRSLGKIRREKIFVGRHVRRKLNT